MSTLCGNIVSQLKYPYLLIIKSRTFIVIYQVKSTQLKYQKNLLLLKLNTMVTLILSLLLLFNSQIIVKIYLQGG